MANKENNSNSGANNLPADDLLFCLEKINQFGSRIY